LISDYIDKVVDMNVKDENVEQILEKLFETSDITYKVLTTIWLFLP